MGDKNTRFLGFSKATYYRKRKLQVRNRVEYRSPQASVEVELPGIQRSDTTHHHRSCLGEKSTESLTENENEGSTVEHSMDFEIAGTSKVAARSDESHNPPQSNTPNQQQACLLSTTRTQVQPNPTEAFVPDLSEKPAILKICQLIQKHSLNDQCTEDILKLLHDPIVYSNRSEIPLTHRGLESATGTATMNIIIGWKCLACNKYSTKTLKQGNHESQLKCCSKSMSYNDDHFILVPLHQTLQLLLPNIEKSFFQNTNNLSEIKLILNTDGAPLFKGSKSSFWPVLGVIDETMFNVRKNNVLLLAIWVGLRQSTKPDFDIFLTPICEEIAKMSKFGVVWKTKEGLTKNTKVKVSAMVCDSIARPLVQNMTQFNAQYGCGYCYHEQSGPYFNHTPISEIDWRTSRDFIIEIGHKVGSGESSSRGVKGPSPVQILPGFDIIFGFPPDVLHIVYLGVTKHLTELWINSNNHMAPYYIKPFQQRQINQRLSMIFPPTRVSRPPRSLDVIKFYKGHEFMMWLLYYSPIVLKDILNDEYYDHWMLLVRGISFLTSTNVNDYIIGEAEKLLELFSSQVLNLYGENHQRFNIHLLLHLGRFVRKYGALQNYSMTVFESFNMQLKKYVSSSYGAARQIAKRYFRDIIVKRFHSKDLVIDNGIFNCSYPYFYVPSLEEEVMIKVNDIGFHGFRYYLRVTCGNCCLHSELYSSLYRHDNSYYKIDEDIFFRAKFYLEHQISRRIYAIGNMYRVQTNKTLQLPHCFEIISEDYRIVEITDKYEVLLKVESETDVVFYRFLNDVEAVNE